MGMVGRIVGEITGEIATGIVIKVGGAEWLLASGSISSVGIITPAGEINQG